jgi:hypothetical protein
MPTIPRTDSSDPDFAFLVACDGGEPLGCGRFKETGDAGTAELKRTCARMDFARIANYGEYAGNMNRVCMAKDLSRPGRGGRA